MVVNVTKYTLFVTSQYDVILRFGVGLTTFVDAVCIFFLHALSLLVIIACNVPL